MGQCRSFFPTRKYVNEHLARTFILFYVYTCVEFIIANEEICIIRITHGLLQKGHILPWLFEIPAVENISAMVHIPLYYGGGGAQLCTNILTAFFFFLLAVLQCFSRVCECVCV